MASNRLDLHAKLVEILGTGNVYYQPPETIKMQYPCIVYEHSRESIWHADDRPYKLDSIYTVTSISRDPESPVPDKIALLRSAAFERHFVADNLHHYVYRIRYIED